MTGFFFDRLYNEKQNSVLAGVPQISIGGTTTWIIALSTTRWAGFAFREPLLGARRPSSHENFPIGTERNPQEIIHAFAVLKKAAALANCKLGNLDMRAAQTPITAAAMKFWRANSTTNFRSSSGG